jgi:outer membrane protein assembly factor BamB
VVGNRVIVSIGGKEHCVVGLDIETGETAWQALDDEASTASGILFNSGVRPGSTPDAVFITPLRIVGLDPIDGTLRWEYPMVFQQAGTSPLPLAYGNKIIASTQAHGAVAVNVKAMEDKLAAEAAWQMPEVKSYFSTGVTSGKQLVLVTNVVEILPSASLTCLDGETGKELWKKKGVGYFAAGVIRTGDDKLLVLNDSGKLTLLEYDDKQVKEVSSANVCGGTLVAPVLADGRLYVRDGKEVICWEFSK